MTQSTERLDEITAASDRLVRWGRNERFPYSLTELCADIALVNRAFIRLDAPIGDDDAYADAVLRCDEYKRRTQPHRRLPHFGTHPR